ncbi:MAG: prepilin-type N-terminal cleavage/methylation domain-containing protein [candidate division NC10 bacterium]|nr:prepilin-type N-terminal cleavage/methylation domain-containing protein [candidate division NC10 bacterium]
MKIPCGPFQLIKDQGLTLVEVLIAMAILSVAMMGVIGLFPVAHQHLRVGGDLTKATALAQRMIEVLRDERLQALPRYHQADTRQHSSFPADDLEGTPPFHGGSSFQRWRDDIASAALSGEVNPSWGRIEVTSIDSGLLSLTVMVGWPATPTERRVQLTTVLSQ